MSDAWQSAHSTSSPASPQLVAALDEELQQTDRTARPTVHSLIGSFGVPEADLSEATAGVEVGVGGVAWPALALVNAELQPDESFSAYRIPG